MKRVNERAETMALKKEKGLPTPQPFLKAFNKM
jgi:hypothetical protein